jgi:uncharacterized protein YidB (DUF937 family)
MEETMGFLDNMADAIITMKKEKRAAEGLLDGLKDTFKKTDIGSTLENFKSRGMEETFLSWVSPDENRPITKTDILNIFDDGTLKDISNKSGISKDEVPEEMSKILPELIDKSTPNGKID